MMKKLLLNLLLLLTFAIGASAQTEVVIGEGTTTTYVTPFNSLWGYSFVEQIYTADEIGMPGTITSVSFNMQSSSTQTNSIDIFMKSVSRSSFTGTSDYEAVTASDMVFSGSVTFSNGWTTITLDTPFEYDGSSNLMIGMHEYTAGYNTLYFFYTNAADKVLTFHSDSSDPDPYNLGSYSGNGYASPNRANITLGITPDASTCLRPTAVTISDVTPRGATVSWIPGADETSWQICFQNDEDNLITVTDTTYSFADLTPESDYTVKVRSICGEGNYSSWSVIRSFTTLIACPKPTALTISNITGHAATATWTSGASETSWMVCLDGDEDAAFEVTDTTYTITGLAPESDYSIKVRANCGGIDGVSAWTNEVWYTTTVSCPAPTNLAMAAYTTTTATLTWDALEAESWLLLYGTDSEFGADTYTELSLTEPTVELTGLTPETVYYARVMANCGVEGESDWSSNLAFEPTAKIVIGSGTATSSYLPTYTYYKYALSQQIYTAAEIGAAGYINSVDFYNAGTVQTRNLNVYVVPTNKTSFASGSDWINATDDYLVFSGNVTFASNVWTSIQFTTPLYYNGTTNLAIIVDDNTGEYESSMGCRVFDATSQAIQIYNDYTDYAPTAPTYDGTLMNVKNQIRLLVEAGDPPACVKPVALAVPTVTGRTATATWSAGADETSWQVCLSDDEDNLIDVTEPTYTFTGLAPESDYTVKVRSNCGDDGYSDWTSNMWFSTLVACPAPTALEASNIGLTTATLTWTAGGSETAWQLIIDGDEDNVIELDAPTYTMTGLAGASDYTAKVRAVCGGEDGESAWTPVYAFTTALCETEEQCQISYSLVDSFGDGWNGNAIRVKDVATNQVLDTWTISTGSTAEGTLSLCNGREIVFEWVSGSYPSETSYTVTDVNGDEIFSGTGTLSTVNHIVNCTSCRVPSDLTASNITVTSADLSWSAGSDETAWQLSINDGDPIDLTDPAYEMTGLDELTNYTVKVRANCGAEQSPWVSMTFTTLSSCPAPVNLEATAETYTANISFDADADSYIVRYAALQTLFEEDFENGFPEGWSNIDADNDGNVWVSSSNPGVYHNESVDLSGTGHNDSEAYVISGSYANQTGTALTPDNWLITPAIQLPSDVESLNLKFYASAQDVSYAAEHYGVYISTTVADDTDAFTLLWEEDMDADGGPHRAGTWGEKNTDLAAYAGETVYIAIRHFNCTDMFILNIDDFSISYVSAWNTVTADASPAELTGLAANTTYLYQVASVCGSDDDNWSEINSFTTMVSCPAPTDLVANNITAHTATIAWTAGAAETAWQVMINDDEDGIVDVEDTPIYEMTELAPESDYSVKVRAYCDVDDQSTWVNVNFTTNIACPAPTALAAHLTPGNGTVATLTWTENGTATAWTFEYGTASDFSDATSMDVTETPSVALTGLTAETTYYARVKTVCGGIDGESAWSSVINFTPTDAYSITLNDGTETNSYVPVYGLWVDDYSRSQFIIPASDLTELQGATITKLTYYSSNTSVTWTGAEFDVRLAEVDGTTVESLATWDDMTLAYHGSLGISGSVMEVTFDTPYTYMGGNLMIGTNETTSGSYASCSWYGVTATGASMGGYGTSISQRNFLPKVTIDFIPGAPRYTITATAGENGTITPSGAVSVEEGQDMEFTITADENYRILSVLVDGAEAINDVVAGVYTFTNVTANHTIDVTFVSETAITYTITASAGEHGTITPSGALSVVEGEDQSFVITPDTDYRIDVLTVDGNVVTLTDEECAGYTYTFTSVYGGHTINVTFTSLNNVEINAAASMAVYPNPNNGMFSIDFSNIEGEATYQLIDARGAVVETREINVTNGETKTFNHTLTAGTYFVRIINGDKVYVEQIVVE